MKTSGIYLLSLLLTATLATGCQKEQRTGITPGKETTVTLPGIHIRQEQFIMPEFQTSANTLAAAEGDDTCPFTVSLQAPTAVDRAWEMIFNGSRAAEIGIERVSLGMTVRCIRDEEW